MNLTEITIGMRGSALVNALNNNFTDVGDNLDNVNEELEIRIVSDTIKQFKCENNVVYYTVDNTNWVSMQATWGSISGTISNQTDLVNYLNTNFASSSSFNNLAEDVTVLTGRVDANEGNIASLLSDVSTLQDVVGNESGGLVLSVRTLEHEIEDVVHSANIVGIRLDTATSVIQYTTDGVNWIDMNTAINWGLIRGDIKNQTDLWNYISTFRSELDTLNQAIIQSGVSNLTQYNYEQLESKKSNQLYNITDIKF